MIKICKECKKEFEARNDKVIYCNENHYRICPICGNKFLVKRKASLNIKDLTCSRECAKKKEQKTRQDLDIKYPKNRKKREGIKSKCKFCGKEIYKYNEKSRDYCATHKVTCYICNKEFDLKSRYLNEKTIKENKFVCSQKCATIKASKNHDYKKSYNTMSKNYFNKTGYKNPWSNPEVRSKINNTIKNVYGEDFHKNMSKNIWNSRTIEEKNEIFNKIKKTNLEKYNVDHIWKSKEMRNKINQNCIDKYGKDLYHYALDKAKEITKEKYGVEYYMQHPDFKNKSKNTLIEKYGENYNLEIIKKSKDTRYKNNNGKYKSNKETLKLINTNMNKYGVPYTCMHYIVSSKNNKTISKINRKIHHMLTELGLNSKYEQNIGGMSYDLCLEEQKILIEINPTYSHQSTKERYFGGKPKPPIAYDYQQNRTLNALKNNYRCIHIFDWDDLNKIINLFKSKNKISARKCTLKEISKKDANEFLNKYHLQNSCRGNDINIALLYNNEIISIATFGKSRYNKEYEYEFLRFANHSDYSIYGGTNKLFNYFIENYKPNSIISYCDNAKFEGKFFENLGFKMKNYGKPSCHWYNIKTKQHFTNNLLLQLGADKLLGTNYGRPEICNMNNRNIMIKEGFVEVYDCGQSIWVWNKLI